MKLIAIFLLWTGVLMPKTEAQMVLKAYDAYGNNRIELVLMENGTYSLNERFLDGSFIRDTGRWEKKSEIITFYSSGKANREHAYLQFKKQKKLNGEKIQLNNGQALFVSKSSRSVTKYYKEFKWSLYPVESTQSQ
jgi:hypothetical protein